MLLPPIYSSNWHIDFCVDKQKLKSCSHILCLLQGFRLWCFSSVRLKTVLFWQWVRLGLPETARGMMWDRDPESVLQTEWPLRQIEIRLKKPCRVCRWPCLYLSNQFCGFPFTYWTRTRHLRPVLVVWIIQLQMILQPHLSQCTPFMYPTACSLLPIYATLLTCPLVFASIISPPENVPHNLQWPSHFCLSSAYSSFKAQPRHI